METLSRISNPIAREYYLAFAKANPRVRLHDPHDFLEGIWREFSVVIDKSEIISLCDTGPDIVPSAEPEVRRVSY
jgi:hypothetical protein